jgi:hypothetical protein
MPACAGVRPPLRVLQGMQQATAFSHSVFPPWTRGTMWSMVRLSLPGVAAQYWQVKRSRR